MRCGGSYDIVSELISLKFGTGWSERSCSDKIPAFFKKLHSDMKDTWLCLDSDILHHESNAVLPFWDKDIKVVMDTVPLYVDSLPHCYQPKYATHVVKALVASTISGYVCFTADTLYCGASSDAVIQDCSGILDFLAHNRVRALADGGFYDGLTDRLIVPHSKDKFGVRSAQNLSLCRNIMIQKQRVKCASMKSWLILDRESNTFFLVRAVANGWLLSSGLVVQIFFTMLFRALSWFITWKCFINMDLKEDVHLLPLRKWKQLKRR